MTPTAFSVVEPAGYRSIPAKRSPAFRHNAIEKLRDPRFGPRQGEQADLVALSA
jgi:hypothetical protein